LIFLYPIFGRSKLLTSKSRERDNAIANLAPLWHAARERYAGDLLKQKSIEWFARC
jgi:hypothetical protein